MYYHSSNRGLSFTKPGIYAFGVILSLGLLAIISGVNGLYLFLSLGLAVVIISGLLSERMMKNSRVAHIPDTVVDANKIFSFNFEAENSSKVHTMFNLRYSFHIEKPRIGLVGGLESSSIDGFVDLMPPGSTKLAVARSQGLSRGVHREIFLFQSTSYPFGLFEKYKFIRQPCMIVVIPNADAELLTELISELSLEFQQMAQDKSADIEFYGHKPFESHHSKKEIDWKRSANKPVDRWVTKEYRADPIRNRVLVTPDWVELCDCTNLDDYEHLINRIRAPFEAFPLLSLDAGLEVGLRLPEGVAVWNREEIYKVLANIPPYKNRMGVIDYLKSIGLESNKDFAGTVSQITPFEMMEISISLGKWSWNRP